MQTRIVRLVFLVLTLSACSTPLRAPVCGVGEFQLPAGAAGRYQLTTIGQSPTYSGSLTLPSNVEFSIKEGDHAYELSVAKTTAKAVSASFSGHKTRAAPALAARQLSSQDSSAADPVMPLSVCKIGSKFYAQQMADDGTYSISLFEVLPSSIVTTSLVFDLDEVRAKGFNLIYAPRFESFDANTKTPWHFDTTEGPRIIIDNLGVDSSAREAFIALARPVAVGMVFARVGQAAAATAPDDVILRVAR